MFIKCHTLAALPATAAATFMLGPGFAAGRSAPRVPSEESSTVLRNAIPVSQLRKPWLREASALLLPSSCAVTSEASRWEENKPVTLYYTGSWQRTHSFFKKDFIYLIIFREKGKEGEREKHRCVIASCAPPTGDLAHSPGVYPDWESNWRPFGSQAGTQSTEPHQPGGHTHFGQRIPIEYSQQSTWWCGSQGNTTADMPRVYAGCQSH